jgi:hypothetical protein
MKKLLLPVLFFGLFSTNSFAQDSDTAQALIDVAAAITITQNQDLDFGTVAQGAAGATIAPADAEAAIFDVAGQANTAYTISFGAASIDMTGPGAAIEVNSFVSLPAAGANGMLDGTGSQELRVGASHGAIPGAQVAGSYAGTFTVEVAY